MRSFLAYYEKVRDTTRKFIEVVPPDKVDWAYKPGKFSIGDLLRHIAAIERHVFAEMAVGRPSRYKGCGKDLADGYQSIVDYVEEMHTAAMNIFKGIPDEALTQEINTLTGRRISLSGFLNALVVHEVHHRAALAIYLNLLNVETPPIIGLKEEQVVELSRETED